MFLFSKKRIITEHSTNKYVNFVNITNKRK